MSIVTYEYFILSNDAAFPVKLESNSMFVSLIRHSYVAACGWSNFRGDVSVGKKYYHLKFHKRYPVLFRIFRCN